MVDCARSSLVPLRLLRRCGVKTIEALVLTHNDADHVGGAAGVLDSYRGCVKKVYWLQDRPPKTMRFLDVCDREITEGRKGKRGQATLW